MSILDQIEDKKITVAYLKSKGYTRINWGAPDYQVELPKDKHDRTKFTFHRTPFRWKRYSHAWEKIIRNNKYPDGISIIYFPNMFNKYVNMDVSKIHYPKNSVFGVSQGQWDERQVFVEDVKTVTDFTAAEHLTLSKLK